MRKQQSGFTIIELVVVIILLGIMAATALPRFMNVTTQAHSSVVEGVQGGLQSGAALFHAQWIAEGQPAAETAIVTFNSLKTTALGYPCGTTCTSGAITNQADCAAIYSGLLQPGSPSVTATGTTAASAVANASDFAAVFATPNCVYYYTAEKSVSGDTVQTLTYAVATGTVTAGTSAI